MTTVMAEQTYSSPLVLVAPCHCEMNQQGTAVKNRSLTYFWFPHLTVPAAPSVINTVTKGCGVAPQQGCFQSSLFLRFSCLGTFCSWHPALRCPVAFPVLRALLLAWRGGPKDSFLKSNNPQNANRKTRKRDLVHESSGVVACCINQSPVYLLNLLFNGKKSTVNKQVA